MKVYVRAKGYNVSPEMVERIENKLSFLEKYILIDENTEAQVLVKEHGNDLKMEVTIPTSVGTIRSEVVDNDLRNAVDKTIDKLESQIRKQKTRLTRKHKEKLAKTFIEETGETATVTPAKTKRVVLDSIDFEEAAMQMELLGHDFFVYRDAESNVVSIVYKREDGGYGVLEAV